MKGTFHIVTDSGEEWRDAELYDSVQTSDTMITEEGEKIKLIGEVLVTFYKRPIGFSINHPYSVRAKSVEFIPDYEPTKQDNYENK